MDQVLVQYLRFVIASWNYGYDGFPLSLCKSKIYDSLISMKYEV